MRGLIGLVLAGLSVLTGHASVCPDCVEAPYWQVDPHYWNAAQPDIDTYPERQLNEPLPGADLGIAFSGGGTRSAAATVGQLRGLVQNKWLQHVKYMTAVSGGSWAAVPFTYFDGEAIVDLLGSFEADSKDIDPNVFRSTPNGQLAMQITRSKLAATGVAESFQFLPDNAGETDLTQIRTNAIVARDLLRRLRGRNLPDSNRENKTYAHLLGQIFIDPLVKDGSRKPYTWTRMAAMGLTDLSRQPQMGFLQVPPKRPFLIVGGTIIWNRDGFVYPRLIPIEYTSLYTGVRQQFGNLGGTYVTPWAYDREHAVVVGERLLVDKATLRMFTLADVVASSGAAPQLQLMLGTGLPLRARAAMGQAAGAFPSFRPFAIRDGQPVAPTGEIAHGDGGFTDNLGLMPLLARRVKHIIAFVNSNTPYAANEQLQSYFFPLATQNGSGDKTMNAVFPRTKYRALLDGLDGVTADGGPAVFCDTMAVLKNELYNIAGYEGLKVCWVYNVAATNWRDGLPETLQRWLNPDPKKGGLKDLRHFPYYATFEENRPYIIKLNALQVNLLANLSGWSITNDTGRLRIRDYVGDSVLPPN